MFAIFLLYFCTTLSVPSQCPPRAARPHSSPPPAPLRTAPAWAGGGWGDINIHIDINMNVDIHIIMNMNIEYYIKYNLLFIRHSLLAIPYWIFI